MLLSASRYKAVLTGVVIHHLDTLTEAPANLPSMEITLNYQAFVLYKRALRLPADNFPLQRLASSPMKAKLKKISSCLSKETMSPENLGFTSPLDPLKLHCNHFY